MPLFSFTINFGRQPFKDFVFVIFNDVLLWDLEDVYT